MMGKLLIILFLLSPIFTSQFNGEPIYAGDTVLPGVGLKGYPRWNWLLFPPYPFSSAGNFSEAPRITKKFFEPSWLPG